MSTATPTAVPFGTRRRNRKPRDFSKTSYKDLPSVLFKEEIKYLYDIIAEQRRQLEHGVEKGAFHAREVKLQLAYLQEQVHQTRGHMLLLRDDNPARAVAYTEMKLREIGQKIVSIKKMI